MAFVMKQPCGSSKGIIILTHKEGILLRSRLGCVRRAIRALKERYLLGMHWGFYLDSVPYTDAIDFDLAADSILARRCNPRVPGINLISRNFVPDMFQPDAAVRKQWDVLTVSNNVRFKRLDQFLRTMRLVYDQRPQTRCLLVAPEDPKASPGRWYTELMDDYARLFSADEQARFDVMLLKRGSRMHPLTQETLAFLLQASKVFTLFSDREGGSKAISESLVSGVPVVVKRTLEGGGRDYLDEYNSRQFDTIEEAATCLLDLIDHGSTFDRDSMARQLSQTYTAATLKDQLSRVFEVCDVPFEGELDLEGLDRKLPSHTTNLPRVWCHRLSDDLRSPLGLLRFIADILGEPPPGVRVRLISTVAWWPRQIRAAASAFAIDCVWRIPGLARLLKRLLRRPSPTS